jgi:hypothetical protein
MTHRIEIASARDATTQQNPSLKNTAHPEQAVVVERVHCRSEASDDQPLAVESADHVAPRLPFLARFGRRPTSLKRLNWRQHSFAGPSE